MSAKSLTFALPPHPPAATTIPRNGWPRSQKKIDEETARHFVFVGDPAKPKTSWSPQETELVTKMVPVLKTEFGHHSASASTHVKAQMAARANRLNLRDEKGGPITDTAQLQKLWLSNKPTLPLCEIMFQVIYHPLSPDGSIMTETYAEQDQLWEKKRLAEMGDMKYSGGDLAATKSGPRGEQIGGSIGGHIARQRTNARDIIDKKWVKRKGALGNPYVELQYMTSKENSKGRSQKKGKKYTPGKNILYKGIMLCDLSPQMRDEADACFGEGWREKVYGEQTPPTLVPATVPGEVMTDVTPLGVDDAEESTMTGSCTGNDNPCLQAQFAALKKELEVTKMLKANAERALMRRVSNGAKQEQMDEEEDQVKKSQETEKEVIKATVRHLLLRILSTPTH